MSLRNRELERKWTKYTQWDESAKYAESELSKNQNESWDREIVPAYTGMSMMQGTSSSGICGHRKGTGYSFSLVILRLRYVLYFVCSIHLAAFLLLIDFSATELLSPCCHWAKGGYNLENIVWLPQKENTAKTQLQQPAPWSHPVQTVYKTWLSTDSKSRIWENEDTTCLQSQSQWIQWDLAVAREVGQVIC